MGDADGRGRGLWGGALEDLMGEQLVLVGWAGRRELSHALGPPPSLSLSSSSSSSSTFITAPKSNRGAGERVAAVGAR